MAQRVVAAIPKGELSVVANAGHSVAGDNPQGFYDAVTSFIANHPEF